MENFPNLSPLQSFFVVGLNIWIFVIFPVMVLRKLNYMANLMEGLYEDEEQEEAAR